MSTQRFEHIEITPEVCGGAPHIAGRRITVADIAMWHKRAGWSSEKIARQFGLTPGQVHAALAYYFDHKIEIGEEIREEEAFAKAFRAQHPSPLKQKLGGQQDYDPGN